MVAHALDGLRGKNFIGNREDARVTGLSDWIDKRDAGRRPHQHLGGQRRGVADRADVHGAGLRVLVRKFFRPDRSGPTTSPPCATARTSSSPAPTRCTCRSTIRTDFFSKNWSLKTQVRMDIAQYLLLFLPGMVMFTWISVEYGARVVGPEGSADGRRGARPLTVQDRDPGELLPDPAAGPGRGAEVRKDAAHRRRLPNLPQKSGDHMSPEVLGLVLLALMFVVILGGFPISFTLILLGCVFGYIGLGNRVFHLMTYQVFDTMTDTVLAAVAMFTFMGYVLESAGLMNRLSTRCSCSSGGCTARSTRHNPSPRRCSPRPPGSSAPRSRSSLSWPLRSMLRSGYDVRMSAGTICAGGTLGILIPPSVMLVVRGRCYRCPWRACTRAPAAGSAARGPLSSSTRWAGVAEPEARAAAHKKSWTVPKGHRPQEFSSGWCRPPRSSSRRSARSSPAGPRRPRARDRLRRGARGDRGARQAHLGVFKDSVYRTAQTASMVMILLMASNFLGSVFSALGTPTFIAQTLVSWNIPADA
jgi:hypothetical protein